jgi:hypothetical protein
MGTKEEPVPMPVGIAGRTMDKEEGIVVVEEVVEEEEGVVVVGAQGNGRRRKKIKPVGVITTGRGGMTKRWQEV